VLFVQLAVVHFFPHDGLVKVSNHKLVGLQGNLVRQELPVGCRRHGGCRGHGGCGLLCGVGTTWTSAASTCPCCGPTASSTTSAGSTASAIVSSLHDFDAICSMEEVISRSHLSLTFVLPSNLTNFGKDAGSRPSGRNQAVYGDGLSLADSPGPFASL
jgi:hypothetical protein